MNTAGYNERLFSRGLRSRLHTARFRWCRRIIRNTGVSLSSVLELGCFDGKTLEWLPALPNRYDGYDANWDGGLEMGRMKWRSYPEIHLHESTTQAGFLEGNTRTYNLSICMETLEHLPRDQVSDYLAKLSSATAAYCLITVPNELGVVFVVKWLAKKWILGSARPYLPREFIWQMLGRVEHVSQREHKGFSYRWLITIGG